MWKKLMVVVTALIAVRGDLDKLYAKTFTRASGKRKRDQPNQTQALVILVYKVSVAEG